MHLLFGDRSLAASDMRSHKGCGFDSFLIEVLSGGKTSDASHSASCNSEPLLQRHTQLSARIAELFPSSFAHCVAQLP